MANLIDLSQTPPPDVVERLDFEEVLAAMREDLIARDPAFDLLLESDPAIKVLEVAAYRETILRGRINEAAQAVLLPYGRDADLDNLATLFGVERLQTVFADPDANPPIEAEFESNAELRRRVQLSLEGLSVAGPEGAYVFHALTADGRVLDASAASPNPGEVVVSVLSREGDGLADQDLLDTVLAAVNAEDVRPLTDLVSVSSAIIVAYTVEATIYLYEGPDAQVVVDNALEALESYTESSHRLGLDVTRSALYAAAHRPGVQRVVLSSPAADLVISPAHAAYCTGINLTYGGVDE